MADIGEHTFLQTVLDAAPGLVLVLDGQRTVRAINATGVAMIGRESAADVVGQTLESLGLFEADFAFHLGTHPIHDIETDLHRPDGGNLPVEVSASISRNAAGEVAAIAIVAHDVSERLRFLAKLAQSNERFRNESTMRAKTQADLIEAQRRAIQALSAPMIRVADAVVAVPVIGVLDAERAGDLRAKLYAHVTAEHAKFAILDLTGADAFDTHAADQLMRIARGVKLLGATCIFAGITAAVARAMIHFDLDFDDVPTVPTMQHAIQLALGALARVSG